MLTRGVYCIAAFTAASAAVVGYAVLNQLSFPAACGMMVLFTGLLALATDASGSEPDQNGRSQTPGVLTNHLQTPPVLHGTLSSREARNVNDSNNANCVRAHSDVELSSFNTATLSASGHVARATTSGVVLRRAAETERTNRVQLFPEVPSRTELRRPPIGNSHRVVHLDTVQPPVSASVSPSRSDLSTTSVRSQQHLLPQFQRLTTGWVLHFHLVSKHNS